MVKTLRLEEGNHVINSMKLTSSDKLLVVTTVDNANDRVYASLRNDNIGLVLQIHQHYFHIYKP